MTDESPKLGKIKRVGGIAGQVQYNVEVTYPGEETHVLGFVGPAESYGGPVVMISESGHQVFVSSDVNARCGTFGPEWVRRFFAPREA